jgi:hypothetical protein
VLQLFDQALRLIAQGRPQKAKLHCAINAFTERLMVIPASAPAAKNEALPAQSGAPRNLLQVHRTGRRAQRWQCRWSALQCRSARSAAD